MNAEKLQKADAQTAQLAPKAESLRAEVDQFNSKINQTNALTSKALSQGDNGADINQQQAQTYTGTDRKLTELDGVNQQIAGAKLMLQTLEMHRCCRSSN